MNAREWLLLGALSVLWGGSFIFNAVALRELAAITLVLARVGVAALALTALVYATGQRLPASWREWGELGVMGALNNVVPFTLIVWAQTQIASGLASILNATTPLFSLILAHWLTREEPLTALRAAGLALGFGGVVVLVGGDAWRGGGVLGQLAVLGATLSYAGSAIYGRRFRGRSHVATAAGMLVASTVLMLPLALAFESPLARAGGLETWAAVLGLALASTALAYVIYFRLLATAGATNVMLVTFLIPVSALVMAAIFLGERPRATALAGMALIFAGLAAIDGRLPARWRRQRGGQ